MSIAKDKKITQKPRMLTLHCSLQEWMDLADEMDKQLAQLEDSPKVRNLFHRLLNRIKIDVFASLTDAKGLRQEGDAMVPDKDGSYRSFRPIKPVSLGTLLSFRSVARLHEERKNWTREMLVEEWNRSMEHARSQAIADGRAIEHEWEAAIDD
jgi:hypothetical protein